MSEMIIVQVSVDQLKNIVNEAVNSAITSFREEMKPKVNQTDDRMMGTREMCRILGIGRSRFEVYKDELVRFGMFKLSGKTASYRIKREDFERFLKSKQT